MGIDLFGSIFSILSREEEIDSRNKDKYGRFPAEASLLYREKILDRPIVDEYLEVLSSVIARTWPGYERKRRQGTVRYSCDVDTPLDPAACSGSQFVLRTCADIVKRRSPSMALRRSVNAIRVLKGDYSRDPNNTFDWILDELCRAGQQATFYFLSSARKGKGYGWYNPDHPHIINTIRNVSENGHTLGLHGAFGSFMDADQISHERKCLQLMFRRAGVNQEVVRNRQHFLQWDSRITPDCLEKAGIQFDSSGGFPERPGFRFGTAIPFPMWDWITQAPIKLVQEPLVLMDCSLLAENYMGLRHFPEACGYGLQLKDRALAFGGDFSILWHNNYLTSAQDRKLLKVLLGNE